MIAIGILGIGMLLVATTFPVGIEETRQIANDTTAPIIANDAFNSLELLLNDPTPRVLIDTDGDGAANGSVRLADMMRKAPANEFVPDLYDPETSYAAPLKAPAYRVSANHWLLGQLYAPAVAAGEIPYVPAWGAPSPEAPNYAWRSSLVAVYPQVMPLAYFGGGGAPSLNGYPYFWSIVYNTDQQPDASNPNRNPTMLNVVLFVTRRIPLTLSYTYLKASVSSGDFSSVVVVCDADGNPVPTAAAAIDVGAKLVLAMPGDREAFYPESDTLTVRDTDPVNARIELNAIYKAYDTGSPPPRVKFWFIPRDPATGTSPLIGVFKRQIRLP